MSFLHSIVVFPLCQSLDFEPVGSASFFIEHDLYHASNMTAAKNCQSVTSLVSMRVLSSHSSPDGLPQNHRRRCKLYFRI